MKADPYAIDRDGWMPIHYAVHSQNSELIKILLDHTPAAEQKQRAGTNVAAVSLSSVLNQDDTEVRRLLLDAGYELS